MDKEKPEQPDLGLEWDRDLLEEFDVPICPNCKQTLFNEDDDKCPKCGQLLDWPGFYIGYVKPGKIDIDEVPEKYREEVRKRMN